MKRFYFFQKISLLLLSFFILAGLFFQADITVKAKGSGSSFLPPLPPPLRDGALDQNFSGTPSLDNGASISRVRLQPDGKILICGTFKVAGGLPRLHIIRLNAEGTTDASFDLIITATGIGNPTAINDIAPQTDGKIVIGGNFNTVNGQAANNIARVNSDGSFDSSFNPGTGPNGAISAIGIQSDGKIITAGNFSTVNSAAHQRIARLNTDGSLDATFNTALQAFFVDPVAAISEQPGNKIYLSGKFIQVNGVSRNGIARINNDGTLDTSFNNPPFSSNSNVIAMAFQPDGKIIAGGPFGYTLSAQSRNGIVRINTDGSFDSTFTGTLGSNNMCQSIYIQNDGRILIGGNFNLVNGTARTNLTRLNSDGTLDNSFTITLTGTDQVSNIIPVAGGNFLIGGIISSVNSVYRDDLARIDASGNLDSAFQSNFGAFGRIFKTLIQPDGKILVAGRFNRLRGFLTEGTGRLNTDGTPDTTFTVNIADGEVDALARQADGKILIGGFFINVNGTARNVLARLNSDGTLDSSFNANSESNNRINDLAVQTDNKILVGGNFPQFNGSARKALVRLNSNGSVDGAFAGNLDTATSGETLVNSLLIKANGQIFIGGIFANVNGTAISRIALLNSDGSLDGSFVPPVTTINSAQVRTLALQSDNKLLVGGSGVSNNQAPILYRLNSNGALDNTFNVGQIGTGFSNDGIYSIIPLPNGKIIAGGNIPSINSAPRSNLVRLLSNGSLDYSFDAKNFELGNPLASAPVYIRSISRQSDGNLIIGGEFSKIGDVPKVGLARILLSNVTRQPFFDFDGDGKTDISIYRPSNGAWYLINSQNNSINIAQFGLANDKTVPADYDGDGKTDIAIFRDGGWYILNSNDLSFRLEGFGLQNDIPAPNDFDGDGKIDIAVFRPSEGNWYLLQSQAGFAAFQFGTNGDRPLVGDFNNDGRGELIIWRPSNGGWFIFDLSDNSFHGISFGLKGDIPVPADYDADGKTDFAVYRPSNGAWYAQLSTGPVTINSFGLSEDIPVAGDYDGDGKADIAVWRPSNGAWYLLRSAAGLQIVPFGQFGDTPAPASFIR